jgi:membrane protease YdiL (CAAX protease family)
MLTGSPAASAATTRKSSWLLPALAILLFSYILFVAALYTGLPKTIAGFYAGQPVGVVASLLAGIFLLIEGAIVLYLDERHSINYALAALFAFALIVVGSQQMPAFFLVLAAPAIFLAAPFYWLVEIKGKGFGNAAQELLLTKKEFMLNVGIGIFGAVLMGISMFGLMIVLAQLGLADQAAVRDKLEAFPWYALLIAVTIIPIAEEIFFRGFLAQRVGTVGSSFLFAIAHWNYGSVAEIIAAFAIGVMLCFMMRFRNSLTTPIVAHALFNAASLSLMQLF